MTRFTRATDAERRAYAAQTPRPVYPLGGYVTISGHRCPVEDLRGDWAAPDPTWEIMAPAGFRFDPDLAHSLLCHDLPDVRERAAYARLEPCPVDCSCQ